MEPIMDRVTDLEIKVSFLENTNAEMDQLIRQLFKRVDELANEIKRVEEESTTAQEEAYSLQDERPPHY
jgi:uncharacterized coiled-coil protein SlyX